MQTIELKEKLCDLMHISCGVSLANIFGCGQGGFRVHRNDVPQHGNVVSLYPGLSGKLHSLVDLTSLHVALHKLLCGVGLLVNNGGKADIIVFANITCDEYGLVICYLVGNLFFY